MNSYNVDLANIVKPNTKLNLSLMNKNKGPIKPTNVFIYKEDGGRTHFSYKTPQNLQIAGQNINNVYDYSVAPFKDAATQNGKLYNIKTNKSDISLYTYDNNFALMSETFKQPQNVNIGEYKLKGNLTKNLNADGSKEYSVITSNYKIKKVHISPEGIITGPKKSSYQLMQEKLIKAINSNKFISKLLKKIK